MTRHKGLLKGQQGCCGTRAGSAESSGVSKRGRPCKGRSPRGGAGVRQAQEGPNDRSEDRHIGDAACTEPGECDESHG